MIYDSSGWNEYVCDFIQLQIKCAPFSVDFYEKCCQIFFRWTGPLKDRGFSPQRAAELQNKCFIPYHFNSLRCFTWFYEIKMQTFTYLMDLHGNIWATVISGKDDFCSWWEILSADLVGTCSTLSDQYSLNIIDKDMILLPRCAEKDPFFF